VFSAKLFNFYFHLKIFEKSKLQKVQDYLSLSK